MNKRIACLILSLLFCNAHASDYFRSVDSNGKVHYGDRPLNNATVEKLHVQSAPTPNAQLSFETQRAHDKFPVVLYTADNCGEACQQAKNYLARRKIPFVEKYLVTPEEIVQYKKDSHGNQVPGLTIGKEYLVGYLESQWAEKLDAAGYQK